MVAGDIVNTAARLQGIAAPGTVLVGEATYRAASGASRSSPPASTTQGQGEGVTALEALRVVAQRGGAGRSRQLEPPFVGRDVEFRLLKDAAPRDAREGRARLVSIVGQAGIGKSRLAWEFLKYVDGLVEGVYWHQGRSLAYGEGISFWALGEMVRARAGIARRDDAGHDPSKLGASIAEYVPDPPDRRWVEPRLAALAGPRRAPGRGARGAVRRVADVLRGIASEAPRSSSSRTSSGRTTACWTSSTACSNGRARSRSSSSPSPGPSCSSGAPDWGAGRRSFVSIALEPLTPGRDGELLDGLVPGLPGAAVKRSWRAPRESRSTPSRP